MSLELYQKLFELYPKYPCIGLACMSISAHSPNRASLMVRKRKFRPGSPTEDTQYGECISRVLEKLKHQLRDSKTTQISNISNLPPP